MPSRSALLVAALVFSSPGCAITEINDALARLEQLHAQQAVVVAQVENLRGTVDDARLDELAGELAAIDQESKKSLAEISDYWQANMDKIQGILDVTGDVADTSIEKLVGVSLPIGSLLVGLVGNMLGIRRRKEVADVAT